MQKRWLILVAVLWTSATLAADDAPTMPVDFTGVWNLDSMASDDLVTQLEILLEGRSLEPAGRPRGGGQGNSGGMGSAGGMGMSGTGSNRSRSGGFGVEETGPGRPEPEADTTARDLSIAMQQLLITVNGADVEIMDGTDVTKIWTPGGTPVQRPGPGGKAAVEQAWWEDDILVLATTGGPVGITRRLHFEDSGYTLVVDVTAKVTGTADRTSARLVYRGF